MSVDVTGMLNNPDAGSLILKTTSLTAEEDGILILADGTVLAQQRRYSYSSSWLNSNTGAHCTWNWVRTETEL